MTITVCPICLSIDGYQHVSRPSGSWANSIEECEVCGTFYCDRDAKEDYLGTERKKTTRAVRAALAHWVRQRDNSNGRPTIDSELIESALRGDLTTPSPGQQVLNLVRMIGDRTKDTGLPLRDLPADLPAQIGSVSRNFAVDLVIELRDRQLVKAMDDNSMKRRNLMWLSLTIDGWEKYETEKRGKLTGGFGFLALKFGDHVLDPFLTDHVKPALKKLGYDIHDMRDRARAGVIDNLMRIDIRDAAFVIADLTHENAGSYWEAGYAEGLGKPVLYICERQKFEDSKSHFDTNHCTTVLWSADDPEGFCRDLVATLRRSVAL